MNPRFLDVQRLDRIVSPDTAVVVGWQHGFLQSHAVLAEAWIPLLLFARLDGIARRSSDVRS